MSSLLLAAGVTLLVWWLCAATYKCSACGRQFMSSNPDKPCPRCNSRLTWRLYS